MTNVQTQFEINYSSFKEAMESEFNIDIKMDHTMKGEYLSDDANFYVIRHTDIRHIADQSFNADYSEYRCIPKDADRHFDINDNKEYHLFASGVHCPIEYTKIVKRRGRTPYSFIEVPTTVVKMEARIVYVGSFQLIDITAEGEFVYRKI